MTNDYSSFNKDKLIFDNWRQFLNESAAPGLAVLDEDEKPPKDKEDKKKPKKLPKGLPPDYFKGKPPKMVPTGDEEKLDKKKRLKELAVEEIEGFLKEQDKKLTDKDYELMKKGDKPESRQS